MISKIRNAIRWARVTAAAINGKQFSVQQVDYLGKVGDCLMIFPYGIHANVLPDSLVAMFAVGGDPDNRAGIAWTPKIRPELAEGEVALYHPPTGAIVKMNSAGGINIVSVSELTIDAPDITINATNITINGDTAFTGALTSNGKDISDAHTHSGVQTGGGNTGPVN